jgi:hypothetical protein
VSFEHARFLDDVDSVDLPYADEIAWCNYCNCHSLYVNAGILTTVLHIRTNKPCFGQMTILLQCIQLYLINHGVHYLAVMYFITVKILLLILVQHNQMGCTKASGGIQHWPNIELFGIVQFA